MPRSGGGGTLGMPRTGGGGPPGRRRSGGPDAGPEVTTLNAAKWLTTKATHISTNSRRPSVSQRRHSVSAARAFTGRPSALRAPGFALRSGRARSWLHLGIEQITFAAHGAQQLRLARGVAELGAQPRHRDVDAAVVDLDTRRARQLDQRVTAEHAPRPLDEGAEQP